MNTATDNPDLERPVTEPDQAPPFDLLAQAEAADTQPPGRSCSSAGPPP